MNGFIEQYEEIRPLLQTGDKVLFAGKGLVSLVIRIVSRGPYSHIGMIVKLAGRLFVLESTSLRKGVKGVQLSLLSTRLAAYDGKVWIRRLYGIERVGLIVNTKETVDELTECFLREHRGKEYERSLFELALAALPGRNKTDLSSLFCSELVAEWDIAAGVLPSCKRPSNEYTPNDYGAGRLVDREILSPCTLGSVIRVK